MAIPASTQIWPYTLDPYDVLDFKIDMSSLLEVGEAVASYTITPLTEATLLGLTIGSAAYAPVLSDSILTIWLSIDISKQADVAFNSVAVLPLELSITTTSTPARKKQKTLAVMVTQK